MTFPWKRKSNTEAAPLSIHLTIDLPLHTAATLAQSAAEDGLTLSQEARRRLTSIKVPCQHIPVPYEIFSRVFATQCDECGIYMSIDVVPDMA